ncbi:hypothetical protein AVEN_138228-1 [Araneus ventricosus]|uniref:Zinc finger PHD-type domain-containing protein n=1 Tax=Araneus ventricosus TaxID=182803 RepID=A0A4Y2MI84_ARAVE|nr:hypothetical protein AVEN_126735-1 [Araneus ventricosus]GBN26192.1 hypothetical protein AVEN_138228-1 [Araneus ventricosus]
MKAVPLNHLKLTGAARKAFASKTPSKIPVSGNQVQSSKRRNKTTLNSKKYSKLPSSSTSANSPSATGDSSSTNSSTSLPASSSSPTSGSSSSPASSYTHLGSAYSAAMRERFSRLSTKCCICKTHQPERLLLCDKEGCLKTYHLKCLGLSIVPQEIWRCPMHFCAFCDGEPVTWCNYCPTGYCEECHRIYPKPDYYNCRHLGYHGPAIFS